MAALSLTRSELEELDAFLLSGTTSSSIMALDTLHGFLTAIALGPTEVPVERCLQYIWNNANAPTSRSGTPEQAGRIVAYIMRIREDIKANLHDPERSFSALFMTRIVHGKQYADGEMWCYGFLQGMELNRDGWTYFLESPAGRGILRPIRLLGADQLPPEEEKLAAGLRKRSALAAAIPAMVEAIGRHFSRQEPAPLQTAEKPEWNRLPPTARFH